jgi:hypothetical protein
MVKNISQDKRVPKQNVVQGSPALLSQEDLVFTKDGIPADALSFNTRNYLSSGFNGDSAFSITSPANVNVTSPDLPEIIELDVPSLADIESIEFEEYPDPLTGVAKYKAIIKIRNSSKEKDSVSGIDASLYNPSGSSTYTFAASTASGSTTKSSYVSNVTWHNAQSKFDPIGGIIIQEPAIEATAQYPSDGNGVPADSTVGSARSRIKSVWRKTESEALAAAKPNI